MKLHGYFKDNAVIQANEDAVVKGLAFPNRPVTAIFESDGIRTENSAVSDSGGAFEINCGKYEAGFREYSLTVVCEKEKITLRHILFGDVYLALGQSNIELRLRYLKDYEKTISDYGKENFRFFDVENVFVNYNGKGIYGLTEGREDFCGEFSWGASDDRERAENTFGFSYIFCGEMRQRVSRPVAMLNLAVGGSNIANWLPREILENNKALAPYGNSLIPENGQSSAGCIYYEKICPLNGFAFKGAIWYLGESMAWEGFDYVAAAAPAFHELLALYRKQLRGGLPVVLMDIGIQSYGAFAPNYLNEQNAFICKGEENVVQCPLYDLSHEWIRPDGNAMYHPIHLIDKIPHAKRAALLAHENFVLNNPLRCPEISSVTFREDHALCTVDCVGRLGTSDGKPIYGFSIASDDGKYVVAEAEFTEENKIKVFSPFVKKPSRIAYAFFLYNNYCNVEAGGLPLLQYRSVYENADEKPYAVFNPAFACRYETFYENAFSAFGGGAGFKNAFGNGKLFGDESCRIRFSDKGVILDMRYRPEAACFAGISPELLIAGQRHELERYDGICIKLEAQKALEFTGIHFRTCEGEQFYLVPTKAGKERRNLRLEEGKETDLYFDLTRAVDCKENTFALSAEKRNKIAEMQITFRNYEKKNSVLLKKIICFYREKTEKPAVEKENRDKMYTYGN